ncbi:flagellar hook protein [Paracoccus laeviglucosivorans]|uniref:Flagellar hook-associated protein 3 FlgL n=1 Tax=Paracoccus laeviglucosivorans TaxID=1197861 RepID=A0A521DT98_9RHOB|nr:flagellar hook protein [Paracoccus laeviglucosivorans]SMO74845.1 flagellar hook-associated protein 3 FlgL [Paracoccus laeviglucosivorans]
MTKLNSVSDLARSYQLRLSQTGLKSKLDTLAKETTTGVKSDIPLALGGDLTRINQLETRLAQLKTHGLNLAEVQGQLSGMQTALEQVQSVAQATGTLLLSEALISSDPALILQIRKAPDEMRGVIAALNTSVAGRFVFSGTRSDQPAMASHADLMAQLTTAVAGQTDPAQILAAINGYFDAPPGGGGFADTGYLGSPGGTTLTAVAPEQKLGSDLTADAPELRDTLRGLSIMAYAAENLTLAPLTLRELTRAAGFLLVNGEGQLTNARSAIGVQEEAAARLKTANDAENSALLIARNGLIAADPYDTATALKEVEANIETIYTLTARLSKLSLTGYL